MKKKGLLFTIIALLIFDLLTAYLTLPTLSLHNLGLWFIVLINLAAISLTIYGIYFPVKQGWKKSRVSVFITAGLAIAMLVGAIFSSQMVNARAYSKILSIETTEHQELPKVSDIRKIPLMDTESSKVLGNRKIGALNEIVSQFEVSDAYMTIAYKDMPVKVSALKYAGFWKWINNRKNGVPGYVMVDPGNLTAEYVELSEGMKYVPSAYLGEDLARHIYFRYPTTFFDDIHFEIDESGKPYYVASTYEYTIGLFGGKKINGAIVVDPVSGEMNKYGINDLPQWVDVVYNGDYIARYFDIYGKLINGFWNSLFGQKGLIESTTTTTYNSDGESVRDNDFGYIVRDNDVYVYTGITAVTNDESNIGYLMANERTGEIRVSYFESTDEDSVMRAAEGEVQEKRYRASFPSLIDVNGTAAYVMVLKDNLGLVKMYAIVDASQYSHMAVDDSLEKALSIFSKGTAVTGDMKEKNITVKRVELVTVGGETMVYLVDGEDNIYYSEFSGELLLIEEGMNVTIETDGTVFKLKK